jgi:predicted dehydrogenase
MDKIRIGFVGAGGMGQMAHLRNYVTLEDCQVVALAEIRQETGKLVAQRYGVPKVYADHKQMLAAEKLDGVVASQPFNRHAVLLPEIYGAVRHVFTEKPLAVSVEAGRALAAAAAKAGCVHMVGYHKRSDPATAAAKETIDEWKATGELGPLKYVRILMPAGDWVASGFIGLLSAGDKAPPLETEPKPADMDDQTYNQYVSFVNYYIHQVNLMRHLLGEPYKVAYAEKTGVLLAVQSASGVPGVIEMTPYQTTVEWEESALVAFQKGYVILRLPAPLATNRCGSVEIYKDPGGGNPGAPGPQRIFPAMPWTHAMRRQAINFVKVCRGEMPPPCDAAEAVLDLEAAREYIRLRFGK